MFPYEHCAQSNSLFPDLSEIERFFCGSIFIVPNTAALSSSVARLEGDAMVVRFEEPFPGGHVCGNYCRRRVSGLVFCVFLQSAPSF